MSEEILSYLRRKKLDILPILPLIRLTLKVSTVEKEIRVYGFCPCFKNFEGELICLNNDSLNDVEHTLFAPDILNRDASLESIKGFEISDGRTCYSSVYTYGGCTYCSSQGAKIRIHKTDIAANMLESAIKLYSLGPTEITVDCASCIYGILLALVLTQDQASIKRYLDEFSLKIAIRFSELQLDEIDENTPYFDVIQEYLVKLLENEYYWKELHERLVVSHGEAHLMKFVSMMEQLNRLQFLFYSQVINIRSVQNSRLLVRMLSQILRTSKNILDLNGEIHSLVASEAIRGNNADELLISRIEEYKGKSRTIDHFFGNIADIMKGSR
ncbi:MAG: hypothetical protein C4K48_04620 [Candidatus Thorarchaeota archaeon]|nr:MAG: hypothetical protein C4K48_04620 [Candidatus Thorarchaeota archaeon]